MPDYTLKLRKLENQRRICSLPSCSKNRWGISPLCGAHAQRSRYYGDPEARPIRESEIKKYRKQVKRFIKKNRDHPAVLAALNAMEKILQPGTKPTRENNFSARYYLHGYLDRLHEGGVDALTALIESTSVWLLAHCEPRRVKDNDALTFALARSVFFCRPMQHTRESYDHTTGETTRLNYKNPGAGPSRLLGVRLRRTLGIFYIRVAETLDHEHEREQMKLMERKRALATPFPQP